jgi:DNA-binding NtrC family response regulator
VPGSPVRILLVEDEAGVAETVVDLLKALGYEVVLFDSGEAALEGMKAADPFDLLISDVVMPGMSGVELACEARRVQPDMGVILTSGFSASSLEEARQDLSDCIFLHKPYSMSDLSRSISEGLGARDGGVTA